MAVKQTAGREALGEFAPKFAELNDDVLFGQVWSREDKLSPAGPQYCNSGGADGAGADGFVLSVPPENRKEQRCDQNGNCGDPDPCGILCGLA